MKQKGLTLLELVFALAIIAIICSYAIQDNSQLRKKNELESLQNNLTSGIRFAKIIALTQEKGVYLVPTVGENWAKGMALHSMANQSLLYQWHCNYSFWEINWKGFSKSLIIASNPQSAASNGRFIITDKANHKQQYLVVNRLGRVIEKPEL